MQARVATTLSQSHSAPCFTAKGRVIRFQKKSRSRAKTLISRDHPTTGFGTHGLQQPAAAFGSGSLLPGVDSFRSTANPPPRTPAASRLALGKRQQAAAVHGHS